MPMRRIGRHSNARASFVLLFCLWTASVLWVPNHVTSAFLVQPSAVTAVGLIGRCPPSTSDIIGTVARGHQLGNNPIWTPRTYRQESLHRTQDGDGGNRNRRRAEMTTFTSGFEDDSDLGGGAREAEEQEEIRVTRPTPSRMGSMPHPRPLQQRRTNVPMGPGKRKPPSYWKDIRNIEREIRQQWESALQLTPTTPTTNRSMEDDDHYDNVTVEETSATTYLLRQLLPRNHPPPIPNEALLAHWKRHDLGSAIRLVGRPILAERLLTEWMGDDEVDHDDDDDDDNISVRWRHLHTDHGGLVDDTAIDALIVPGKWKGAVQWPIVRHVIEADARLSMDRAPPSKQQLQRMMERYNMTNEGIEEWLMQKGQWERQEPAMDGQIRKLPRKESGYWTKETTMEGLFEYLNERKRTLNIPSVWMPRLSELNIGLRLAIVKHFGRDSKAICHQAGLVPYREWNYIERQHDLMVTLRDYLDEHCAGDYTVFPQYVKLRLEGHARLFRLIQDFGGRRFVAARLGMHRHRKVAVPAQTTTAHNQNNDGGSQNLPGAELNWGPFDLEFGIALLNFVRARQMRLDPPLTQPMIAMPTRAQLLSGDGVDEDYDGIGRYLDQKIVEYGGYENVARRLGLAYFVKEGAKNGRSKGTKGKRN